MVSSGHLVLQILSNLFFCEWLFQSAFCKLFIDLDHSHANYCSRSHSCHIVIFDFISSDFKLLHLVRYWIISLQLVVPDHLYMNNEHCCSRSLFANCPYVLLLLRLSLRVSLELVLEVPGVKGPAVTNI